MSLGLQENHETDTLHYSLDSLVIVYTNTATLKFKHNIK